MLHQLHKKSGFAIGPILMAIALVAVITAFISISVSNSSNTTSNERTRSIADILISQAGEIKQAYEDARDLGYNQDEVLLQDSGCAAGEFCLYADNTGSIPEPDIPATATTQTTSWYILEKTDYRPDRVTNICSSTQGAYCNLLLLRYIPKDLCMMINHILHNKPYKEVTLADTSNLWSNPMLSGPDILANTSFLVNGTDYENVTSGCVFRPSTTEYVYFTFLDP